MEFKDFAALQGALEMPSAIQKHSRTLAAVGGNQVLGDCPRFGERPQARQKRLDLLHLGNGRRHGTCASAVFGRNPVFPEITNVRAGDILSISGSVAFYNNNFRPEISEVYKKDAEFAERMGKPLVPVSPYDPGQNARRA